MNPQLSEDHLNVLYLVHARQDIFTGCRGLGEVTRRLNQLGDLHRAGLISQRDPVSEIDSARMAAVIGELPTLAMAA